jgi:hypothetical protein
MKVESHRPNAWRAASLIEQEYLSCSFSPRVLDGEGSEP